MPFGEVEDASGSALAAVSDAWYLDWKSDAATCTAPLLASMRVCWIAMEVWWASDDRTASISVTVRSESDASAGRQSRTSAAIFIEASSEFRHSPIRPGLKELAPAAGASAEATVVFHPVATAGPGIDGVVASGYLLQFGFRELCVGGRHRLAVVVGVVRVGHFFLLF